MPLAIWTNIADSAAKLHKIPHICNPKIISSGPLHKTRVFPYPMDCFQNNIIMVSFSCTCLAFLPGYLSLPFFCSTFAPLYVVHYFVDHKSVNQ